MSHDQLAKSLIETFFPDFLRLALPDTALRLRLGDAIFLDKELYTDWPAGNRRELDLLARVPVAETEMHLLIHVEIETKARSGMDQRFWRYYMQVRLRHDLLVLPILVNLRGGLPGMKLEVLEEGFEPLPTGIFRFRVLGLSGCQAAEWLPRPEPLAWALAALMDPGAWSRAELKVECLRRVRRWGGTNGRKDVLINWIETYVQLSGEDAAEYQRLLNLKDNEEIRQMEQTWLGRAEARGLKKGIEKGKAQAVEQMRQMVLREIEQRFGAVPERVAARVRAIRTLEPLGKMLKELSSIQSPDDLLSRRRSLAES